ncbi:MAG: WG repeat-containing protein [Desulfobacterales bacterium]|nr:WG repeat-containing protein [Desulfobacterales bacterium]
MKKLILTLLFFLFLALPVFGAELGWKYVTHNTNKNVIYYDVLPNGVFLYEKKINNAEVQVGEDQNGNVVFEKKYNYIMVAEHDGKPTRYLLAKIKGDKYDILDLNGELLLKAPDIDHCERPQIIPDLDVVIFGAKDPDDNANRYRRLYYLYSVTTGQKLVGPMAQISFDILKKRVTFQKDHNVNDKGLIFINKGKVVLTGPQYIDKSRDSLIVLQDKQTNKYHCADKTGVLSKAFDAIQSLPTDISDIMLVTEGGKKYPAKIDGTIISKAVKKAFRERQGYISYLKDGKTGFMSCNGKEIIPPVNHSNCKYFGDNFFPVKKVKESNYAIYNNRNEIILDNVQEIKKFKNHNLIPVKIGGKWGYFDKSSSKMALNPQYGKAGVFNGDVASVQGAQGKYYLINKKGKKISKAYAFIDVMNEYGFAGFKQNDKYGVIDNKGNIVVKALYTKLSGVGDLNHEGVGRLEGYLSGKGKVVTLKYLQKGFFKEPWQKCRAYKNMDKSIPGYKKIGVRYWDYDGQNAVKQFITPFIFEDCERAYPTTVKGKGYMFVTNPEGYSQIIELFEK